MIVPLSLIQNPSPKVMSVDVGGTTTKIWLGTKRVKLYPTNLPQLKSNLAAQCRSSKPDHLLVGMRGVWNNQEKTFWAKALKSLSPKLTVVSDVELAHWMVFGQSSGIILVAGTGSICLGRKNNGPYVRAGGLGPILGDDGSGFWIGREVVKRIWLEKKPIETVRAFIKGDHALSKISSLAKKTIQKAHNFPLSEEAKIIDEARQHLLLILKRVEMSLSSSSNDKTMPSPSSFPIYLHGGLFRNSFFRQQFCRLLPHAKLSTSSLYGFQL